MAGRSIVEYFAEHEAYRCGYCGNTDTNYSHGMWAHTMTVQDYQDLIDRGWRRSGCYVYKPTMDQTCCPQYPIRCNAMEFKISKSQKKIIKRVNRFLNTGARPNKKELEQDVSEAAASGRQFIPGLDKSGSKGASDDAAAVQNQAKDTYSNDKTDPQTSKEKEQVKNGPQTASLDVADGGVPSSAGDSKTRKVPRPGLGADPTKPQCKKAKLMRKERRLEKLAKLGDTAVKPPKAQPAGKSLEDLLNEISENPAHKLEIKLVRNGSNEFAKRGQESYQVFRKYQMGIHKEKPEDCGFSGYKQFLCDSPLQPEQHEGGFPDGFGSFHQHYILDGKIIAVGVIDILPHCTSSVYLYYDPEYYFLSLGNYSALREVAFTRYLHTMEPSIRYYYMGFYIHSCQKMRYKGKYDPSFLNCPQTYGWYPVSEAGLKLDVNKYSRFAEDGVVDSNGDVDVNKVLVLHKRQPMPYMMYRIMNSDADDEVEVTQYAQFVGRTCAERMLLYRS